MYFATLHKTNAPLLPMVTSSGDFDQLLIADLCQQMQEMKLRVSNLEEMETRMDEMQQEIDELRRNCTCKSDRNPKRSKGLVRSQQSKKILKGKYSDAIISIFRSECPDDEDPQKLAGNKSERIYGVPSVGKSNPTAKRLLVASAIELHREGKAIQHLD
ncbi:hypothetical protein EDC96DRAFT_48550 [Choanephora cucurbitarum]|nr:hypothetical protein EDC96DRAFT_48550 [Choanephora cucurbitarum]